MESFKNYISEKPKNYVIKMDTLDNYFLLDSEGKEIKKYAIPFYTGKVGI